MTGTLRGVSRQRGTGRAKASRWIGVVLVSVVAGCKADSPTKPEIDLAGPSYAKGGGGGGGGGSGGGGSIVVQTVNPPSAVRDTTIDVTITGSGFASGARAVWSVAGDTSQVHVKSTKFVSSTQLIAQIEVPATATVASYDVEVMLRDGKKGIGAELFEVLIGDPLASFHFPVGAAVDVRSDDLYQTAGYSVYSTGVCGVYAKMYATGSLASGGDATMQTNNNRYRDHKCPAYPRTLTLTYSDGVVETAPVFMNVRNVQSGISSIGIGATVKRALAIQTPRCEQLLWSSVRQGVPIPADSVLVTRLASDTWRVQSQPPPNNKASCQANGVVYDMDVDFTVVTDRPLP